ncbi:hypothetical protein [Halosimplex halobium]|uniref:hypothetical protein n=1 Tax=Halosimplex halobium TaxID=3396618 RepID=UPI003F54CA84
MTDLGPVGVHLHHTMTGTYPLRLLDVLFCSERVAAVEYGYATPTDLASGGAERSADAFAATLQQEGLAAALEAAEDCRTIRYDRLERVVVFDGGAVGREKLLLEAGDDALSVRVHGPLDLDRFTGAVRSVLEPHEATVERRRGLGLTAGGLF